MTPDTLIMALTTIVLRLEKEAQENMFSDNPIYVRIRSHANDSLQTVQRILADDWLVGRLVLELNKRQNEAA